MLRNTLVIAACAGLLLAGSGCSSEEVKAESDQAAAPAAQALTPEQAKIKAMHDEAIMLDKAYKAAFDAKDAELFKQAVKMGQTLVRRDEKTMRTDNPVYPCYWAFTQLNLSWSMAWDTLNSSQASEADRADDSERLAEAHKALNACGSAVEAKPKT